MHLEISQFSAGYVPEVLVAELPAGGRGLPFFRGEGLWYDRRFCSDCNGPDLDLLVERLPCTDLFLGLIFSSFGPLGSFLNLFSTFCKIFCINPSLKKLAAFLALTAPA